MSILHEAILRCPVRDVSTAKGWQRFIKWLAENNLNWASSPVVVPATARLADSTGTAQFILAHGILTGTARDGETVTFARAFSGVPVVIFGDGGLSYDSTIGSATSQQRRMTAGSLTATGFVMSAKIAAVGTGVTPRTLNFSAVYGASDTATKALAAEAYDDTYTCSGTVRTVNQSPGSIVTVGLYTKTSVGSYILRYSTIVYGDETTPPFTLETPVTCDVVVDGLDAGSVFKWEIISDTNGDSSIKGSTVTYSEASVSAENSATPTGVSSISWIAMGGT